MMTVIDTDICDRSDIRSKIIKTRWFAEYLETHGNIDSKRAFPTGVLDR